MARNKEKGQRCVALAAAAVMSSICLLVLMQWMKINTLPRHRTSFVIIESVAEPTRRPDDYEIVTVNGSESYFSGLEVRTTATNFEGRVRQFNAAVETIRRRTLMGRRVGLNDSWTNEMDPNGRITVVYGARDDFMTELTACDRITTVVLPWQNETAGPRVRPWSSLTDHSNVPYQVYYEWTADNTLCTWIETPGVIKLKADVVYNFTCNRNINATMKPRSLIPSILRSKPLYSDQYWPNGGKSYPAHFYTDPPSFVTYMFIHTDAVVTVLGAVFSRNCKLVLYGCNDDIGKTLPANFNDLPVYDDVFVISQYWGTAVFHRMVEIMPRVALHLDFLRANPQIRISAPEGDGGRLAELFRIVGLDPSRLVAGEIRGKVVYQPRSTGCGFANVQEPQVLNRLYIEYIRRNFPAQPRNRLLVLRRSGLRRFTEQTKIEELSERLAREFGLNFTVFGDNPTPSLNDTMQLFHSSAVVVGPVGAGLSNMYFAQPGTFVIEGVCNLPHVNLCLHRLAYILGAHWHGVTSRGGCEGIVDVPASEIEAALRDYLRLWSAQQNVTRSDR